YNGNKALTFTIKPISVLFEVDEDADITYNGTIQEFPYSVIVDSNNNEGANLEKLQSILNVERAGYAWYYDASLTTDQMGRTDLGYGLIVKLIALQYLCDLGTYVDNGVTKNIYGGKTTISDGTNLEFYSAGKYWFNEIILRKIVNGAETQVDNSNFKWTYHVSGKPQQHSSDNVVYATIKPAQLDIYAVYSRKVFGTTSDPIVELLEGSYEQLNGRELNGNPNFTNFYTYVTLDGLLGDDINDYTASNGKYLNSLKACWSRAEGQGKNVYAVFFNILNHAYDQDGNDVGIDPNLFPLLNNYGIKISGTQATYATSNGANGGGINLYRVNSVIDTATPDDYSDDVFVFDGESVSAPYNYLGAETIVDSYKVFEILPLIMSAPSLEDQDDYVYNGIAQGPQYSFGGMATDNDIPEADRQTQILGLSIPEGWATMTDAQKQDHVDANLALAVPVGTNKNSNIVAPYTPDGEGSNAYFDYLYFTQINAGSYGVILVGASNQNFQFSTYYVIEWTISPKTIGANVSNATATIDGTENGTYFGDKNYGGIKVRFSGIVAGDSLTLGHTATFNNVEDANFFRYSTLDSNIQNDVDYYLYGKYVGKYKFTLSSIAEAERQTPHAHNSVYGKKASTNYTFDPEAHAWSVEKRPLNATISATNSFIYNAGAQGVTIVIDNLYAANFNEDVAYSAMIAEITASNTIIFTASHLTQDNLTSFTVGKPVYSNDTFTFTFTTYNADTYSAIISDVQYVVGSTDYDNYSLSPVDTSYTITPKTIRLNWNLVDEDDNVIADTTADAYTVVYDKTTYTMVASFQTTGEYGVYSADYDEATGKIALVKDGPKDTALVYGGTYYAVNVGTYTASVNNLPSGNYVIATSGDEALGELRTTEWTITRRLLTQIDFGDDVGSTKVYDGSPLSVYFTLPELIEGDTIETFGIFDGLTSVDGKSKLAFKNDGVSFSLSAIDAG
ncbi:MAG: hypothetical protein J6R35_01325, partial [Clostridia bacterium]|nr:hypothetical protein [Clostridia bacterium]